MSDEEGRVQQPVWGKRFYDKFYRGLSWAFQYLFIFLGLVFAPISTVIALVLMLRNRRKGQAKESFNDFMKHHLYTAIALLVLEVGVLHWLFPVTNFVANALLGFLGGPLVWIIFGAALGALLVACVLTHLHGKEPVRGERPSAKAGFVERFGLPIVTFIFAPFSTILGLLMAKVGKSKTSFAQLIKDNPFIAFGFAALEVGLLHWLAPSTDFVLGLTFQAIGTVVSVSSPILWILVGLVVVLLAYGLWRSSRSASPSREPLRDADTELREGVKAERLPAPANHPDQATLWQQNQQEQEDTEWSAKITANRSGGTGTFGPVADAPYQ